MSDFPFGLFNPPQYRLPAPTVLGASSATDTLENLQPPVQPWAFDLSIFGTLLPEIAVRPRVFVSYQHSSDQYYYDQFSSIFHDIYETMYDASLSRCVDSDNPEYVMQHIRDEYLTGTSCTIVLVGPTAYQRKFIDWEIKATLDKQHGLIGIQLPNVIPDYLGRVRIPERLNANINSGYALWQGFTWQTLLADPSSLYRLIQIATNKEKWRIVNSKEIKKKNG